MAVIKFYPYIYIIMIGKTFGRKPSGERLKKIQQSPNYKHGTFQNIEPTEVLLKTASRMKMLKDFLNKSKSVNPPKKLPSVKTNLKDIIADKPTIVWFGHSSYFIKSKDYNILVDPVFSGSAAPFSFMVESFDGADIYNVDDLPIIDLLVITHDHYDHLNYPTIIKLKDKIKQIIAPLGVGAHLEYWGIDPNKITELDWWDEKNINEEIKFIATPARHFTGRSIKRNETLWTSYVLYIHGNKIFLGGDSGYDKQFKIIGEKHGPFDLAILESGQYGDAWPYIHMLPEETVQAAIDLGAKVLLPVHWGKFALAYHDWNDPIKRIMQASDKITVVNPKIGELYIIGNSFENEKWWDLV